MVHWFLYYLLQSLRLYSLCGYASPAAHVTQPNLKWNAPAAYTDDVGDLPTVGVLLWEGQECRTRFLVPIGTARPGTATKAWIINKSWISEDLLAIVHGEYPRQMI